MANVSREEFDNVVSRVSALEQSKGQQTHSTESNFGGAPAEQSQFVDPTMWTPNEWAWFHEHPEAWRYVETPKWTQAINSYGPGGPNYEGDKSQRPPQKPENIKQFLPD